MSRNLGRTTCRVCGHEVVLSGKVRPLTRKDAGVYVKDLEGMLVALAVCTWCKTKYLAWVDERTRIRPPPFTLRGPEPDRPFFDLSFRSTFNDEPSDADYGLPPHIIASLRDGWAAQAMLAEIRALLSPS